MKKSFNTLDIATITTGIALNPDGFSGTCDLFEFLYPGIGPFAMTTVADSATNYLISNIPILKTIPETTKDNYVSVTKWINDHLPKSFEVEGPIK